MLLRFLGGYSKIENILGPSVSREMQKNLITFASLITSFNTIFLIHGLYTVCSAVVQVQVHPNNDLVYLLKDHQLSVGCHAASISEVWIS